jgi:predicted ATPase
LYQRLGSGRRVRVHRAVGSRLEAAYGAQGSQLAAGLAVHFEHGRDYRRAVRYRRLAAANAVQRYAYPEAIDHLTTPVDLLATLPSTPERAQQGLEIQIALGPALFAVKGQGAPEVERAYRRAHALCQQVEEAEQLAPVLAGLRMWYFARAELQVSHEFSGRLLRLAQQVQDPALLLEAHRSMGMTWFCQGELAVARTHLEHGIALSTSHLSRAPLGHRPVPGMTPAVARHGYAAWVL